MTEADLPRDLAGYIEREEGRRLAAYDDATGLPVPAGGVCAGVLTIGVGHTGADVVPGLVWTGHQCDAAKERDIALAAGAAGQIIGPDVWRRLCEVRRSAAIDLVFQLGAHGFGAFVQTIAAIRAYDWPVAGAVLLVSGRDPSQPSRYAREVPARAARTAYMLKTGQWPGVDLWS